MPEMRMTADTTELVRDLARPAQEAEKAAVKAADAIQKVTNSYLDANKAAERLAATQAKAFARVAMSAGQAMAKARDDEFQEQRLAPFRASAQSTDGRVVSANIARAAQETRADAVHAWGESIIADAKGKPKAESGVITELTSKFAGLVTVTGAVSLALAAFRFNVQNRVDDHRNAGTLSADAGERLKQLGNAAAILGLNSEQMGKARQPGKMTTVQENEEFIKQVSDAQGSKPFGVPKATPGEITSALELYKRTGNKNLAGVFGLPNATPGAVDQLLKMRLAQDAGKIGDLPNAEKNYLDRIDPDAKKEMELQAKLSGVSVRASRERYDEGNPDRIAADFRKYQHDSGLIGRVTSNIEDITDWMGFGEANRNYDIRGGRSMMPISQDEINEAKIRRDVWMKLNKTTAVRPSIGRVGDK